MALTKEISALLSNPQSPNSSLPQWIPQQQRLLLGNGHSLLVGSSKDWILQGPRGERAVLNMGPYAGSKAPSTHRLADGSLLQMKTKPVGDGSVHVLEALTLNTGRQSLLIKPQPSGAPQIDVVPVSDKKTTALKGLIKGPIDKSKFPPPASNDLPPREILPSNFGNKRGESLDAKFNGMDNEMSKRLKEYQEKQKTSQGGNKEWNFYQDLIKATQEDLQELRSNRSRGSTKDKVNLYNRLNHEFYLEVKYNVNLTGKGMAWTTQDLNELDRQLFKMPFSMTRDDAKLHEIRLEKMPPGVGGLNYGNGLITVPTGGLGHAMIHEIGHNHEDENPRWQEFQNLSGWREVTGDFSKIAGDYPGGEYKPYDGTAVLKRDGKTYKDGDQVDLDGNGTADGIIQVQHGKVMMHRLDAKFIDSYSRVNPREDFASTFDHFFSSRASAEQLRRDCPEKYQFMITYTGVDPTKTKMKPIIKW